jgi:hypothetical protein
VELPLSYQMVLYAHHYELTGFPYNIMDNLYFYGCNWSLPMPDYPPTSNQPGDITTSLGGTETIDWVLHDDNEGGQYRIWANNSKGNYYVWVDWTPWTNNTPLNIPINRTLTGVYNYTIEFYDNNTQYGVSDSVLVTISVTVPTSNHPDDIMTTPIGSETIDWVLYDEFGGGQYRVLANDTNDVYYVWVDWTPWTNNTPLNIPINRTLPGVYNYVIEFYNDFTQHGIPDSVIVSISDSIPTSNHPANIITTTTGSEIINWTLYDDFGGGYYRVWTDNLDGDFYIWVGWTPWINNSPIIIQINRFAIGIFNYTIEYYDSSGQFGKSDTVIVAVIDCGEEQPGIPGPNVVLVIVSILSTSLLLVGKIIHKKKRREKNSI